jgi:hypothetical protein
MFKQINCIKKILQFVRGVVGTWKTQIIKVIQFFFEKQMMNKNFTLQHTLQTQHY